MRQHLTHLGNGSVFSTVCIKKSLESYAGNTSSSPEDLKNALAAFFLLTYSGVGWMLEFEKKPVLY